MGTGSIEARAAYYTTRRLMDLWEAAEDGSAEGELYNSAHYASCSLDYEHGGEASFPLSRESYDELVADHRAALLALPWPPVAIVEQITALDAVGAFKPFDLTGEDLLRAVAEA